MKVLGEYVLIEQVVKSKSAIIIAGNKNDKGNFNSTFKILQIASEVPTTSGLSVGDVPVLGADVRFAGVKIITKDDKTGEGIMHIVIHYSDIIAIE